ncbi:YciI family protein [Sphingomonas sp. Sphisp140]|uniref:YciI family protein n=1 Tax=unclassified Sphingomonas TaxID=196159 RepID=UPI0039B05251
MRVMVFVKASEDTENGIPPAAEAFAAMDRFAEELAHAGLLVAGAELQPSASAKRILVDGSVRTVIDGPFAEVREMVTGFSIWEVKDMDEAVAWARRCPNTMAVPSTIELWPFLEAEDPAT